MAHHIRFHRFSHRTQIPTNYDLPIEEFFAEDKPVNKNEEDVVLLEAKAKSRPFKDTMKERQQ